MNRNYLLTSLAVLLSFSYAYGQTTVFSYDQAAEKKIIEAITTRHKKDVSSLKGSNKKYIGDIYKERFELIKEKIISKEILTDTKAQEYLNTLLVEILKQNQFLKPEEFRVFFSRTYLPNATSMGEGTILFNIGLFQRLQNESQAAFVLCHELAHDVLAHSNKNIEQYVNTVYSEEFQKRLKGIHRSEYNQNQQLEALSSGLLFKSRRHSRSLEQSADSMALELMKNTRYNIKEALTALALLDSVDKSKYGGDLDLSKVFHFSAFPFKKRWLESEDIIFVNSKEEKEKKAHEKDSLKTHPDCASRIAALSPKVDQYFQPQSQKFIVSEKSFQELKTAFDYETIEYAFQSSNISRSLMLALQMLQSQPGNAYPQAMVGKCLNKIYTAQKNHQLNKIVGLPNPGYDASYNNLLQMIQNLRLTEIAALTYFFLQQYEQQSSTNKAFVEALIDSKENFGKTDEKQQWLKYYSEKFSNKQ